MTTSEFKYVKEVYDECVMGGLLIPEKLRKAYWIITGRKEEEPIVGIKKAKLKIFSFMQYDAAKLMSELDDIMTDKTETVEPVDSAASPTEKDDTQSHSEDEENYKIAEANGEEIRNTTDNFEITEFEALEKMENAYKDISEKTDELKELEANYANATEANEKRSLKMKINKIKKDANIQ